jgi:glucuronosyltransferase
MIFAIQCTVVYGARILVIESCGSYSHWQYMKSIVDVLTKRHHVTAITPILSGDQQNYTEIDATSVFPVYGERDTMDLIESYSSVFHMVPLYPKNSFERSICDSFYAFEPVKRILKANDGSAKANRFDMIVMEPFYSSCLSYLAYRLRIPEVHVYPSSLSTSLELMVEPNSNYVFNPLLKGLNLHRYIPIQLQYFYAKFVPLLTEIRMKYKKPRRYDVVGLNHKPSGVLSNMLNIVDTPRRSIENMERIGGIHLKPPNALPDVSSFLL